MQLNFQREFEALSGQQHVEFLLDTARILAKYAHAQHALGNCVPVAFSQPPYTQEVLRPLKVCHEANRSLCMQRHLGSARDRNTRVAVPTKCSSCAGLLVDDSERATFVCTVCGLEVRYFFPPNNLCLPRNDARFGSRSSSRVFRPLIYFKQRMREVQGQLPKRFDQRVFACLIADQKARGIARVDISPDTVYHSLKRLGYPKLYRYRWGIASKINSTFEPLQLSDELFQQLCALFTSVNMRFTLYRTRTGSTRKNFFPYDLFARCALRSLGHFNKARFFNALKSHELTREHEKVLNVLLKEVL